jgi:alpha-glucuronidase
MEAIGVRDVSEVSRASSEIVFATTEALSAEDEKLGAAARALAPAHDEGYAIFTWHGKRFATSAGERGLLHAYFRLLREDHRIDDYDTIVDHPDHPIRMIDQWDNMTVDMMGSVERGYAGDSIFFADGHIVQDVQRVVDYARLLASAGVNAISINNVNVHRVETRLLVDQLDDVAELAAIFRQYGIALYVSVNFASPIDVGGLQTADPCDPSVVEWWSRFVERVYRSIPDFGGFVVKADSEGRPGPFNYGRNHAHGANLLARALAPYGGTLFWRCFVYNSQQDWRDRSTDRARAAFDHFMPLDGKFDDNVVLQIKDGPMDFQVREPVSPLLGGLSMTNIALELQITQEYTGHQIDLFYLPKRWEEILSFDFNAHGTSDESRTTASLVSGGSHAVTGIVGVSNVGSDFNWTGNMLAQANLYGFGRLSWGGQATAKSILDEWVQLTFGHLDAKASDTITQLLIRSPDVYENYTAPLGVGFMVTPHTHYGPNVDGYEYSRWGTYHFADLYGVGVDRTRASGTGYAGQYPAGWAERFEDVRTCPDELLLFFHHVPYTHMLHSGKTVIQHIYDSHFDGYRQVEVMLEMWRALETQLDPGTYADVLERLRLQLLNAREWRDQVITYFLRKSGIQDQQGRIIST